MPVRIEGGRLNGARADLEIRMQARDSTEPGRVNGGLWDARGRSGTLGLLVLSWLASPGLAEPQMVTCVSSLTSGEQLSLELTPDGSRGFLAQGATIAVLDLSGAAPSEIARHPVPDCQPLAARYRQEATGERYLFIGGGALGVLRLTLCPGWFQTPITACPGHNWAELLVQQPLEYGYFERKRCVDVEILETSNGPVLFALFAASSSPAESEGGPTELRAYTWTSTTATQVAALSFDSAASPMQIGTSLAVDPADADSIYVGMGKGGIWRVDLASGGGGYTLAKSIVWAPGCASCPTCTGGSYGVQHVRDLAIVRVETNPAESVLYAALNYDELLELRDLGGSPSCTQVTLGAYPARPHGFPERITAIVDQGTNVLVAVAAQGLPGKEDETAAPYVVNGVWTGICLGGVEDPDAPPFPQPPPPNPPIVEGQFQFYTHDFSLAGTSLTYRSRRSYIAAGPEGKPVSPIWNSVAFRNVTGSSAKRLTVCSQMVGTETFDVDPVAGTSAAIHAPYASDAFRGQDSVVSSRNNGVVQFCQEWEGAVVEPRQMAYIDPQTSAITPVDGTQWSPCTNDYPASSCSDLREPALYATGLLETAHWGDSADANREYFVVGRRMLEPIDASCNVVASCTQNPCAGGNPSWSWRLKDYNPLPSGTTRRNGWRVTNLLMPLQGIAPANGPSLDPRWWQVDLPEVAGETSETTNDRVQSITDPRTTGGANGIPTALYLSRSGTTHVKAVRPSDVEAAASATCPQYGNGEFLQLGGTPAMASGLAHVEFEENGGQPTSNPQEKYGPCKVVAPCPGLTVTSARAIGNNHSTVYSTRDGSGSTMYVWASASGFVASGPEIPSVQSIHCQWTGFATLPMLALLDVTQTGDGSLSDPKLQRIGLGTIPGHAFCVATKTSGRKTFAYVGDLLGRIWVFKVDGSELFPSPPSNSPPGPTTTYLGSNTPILEPLDVLEMPRDPCDGVQANCIDLEIVGNYLYCALARLGVAVIDISTPDSPQLVHVMDTPGLALGLSVRTIGQGPTAVTQLIVGDARCGGARVYQ